MVGKVQVKKEMKNLCKICVNYFYTFWPKIKIIFKKIYTIFTSDLHALNILNTNYTNFSHKFAQILHFSQFYKCFALNLLMLYIFCWFYTNFTHILHSFCTCVNFFTHLPGYLSSIVLGCKRLTQQPWCLRMIVKKNLYEYILLLKILKIMIQNHCLVYHLMVLILSFKIVALWMWLSVSWAHLFLPEAKPTGLVAVLSVRVCVCVD